MSCADGGRAAARLAGMESTDLVERVRTLRRAGRSPKQIARALGVRPAVVAPVVRALAAQEWDSATERRVVGCWVSPGWSSALTVDGHPDWPADRRDDPSRSGLAGVLVAREGARGRVAVCGYLVDTYCLGVKDALGPRVMSRHALGSFVGLFFGAFDGDPLPASLELAQHLVLGAVDYARALGFEPHPDFEPARGHLGAWHGPSDIGFGRDGKPFFVQGPYDDSSRVMATLQRTVGLDNFHFLVTV